MGAFNTAFDTVNLRRPTLSLNHAHARLEAVLSRLNISMREHLVCRATL